MKNISEKEEDWIAYLSPVILVNLNFICSQQLVHSHLLLFGCFVSSYKKKVMDRIQSVLDSGKEKDVDCVQLFNKDLEDYNQIRDSISLSLFLIFTMLTVASVLFINHTIQYFMFEDDIFSKLLFSTWCCFLCLILVYLCLVADETEQTRQAYIHHIW